MIEFCSKKRMIAAIIILVIISTVILLMESQLPVGNEMKSVTNTPHEADNASKLCMDSTVRIVSACHICTDLQQKMLPACKISGYVETRKCQTSLGREEEFSLSCLMASRNEEHRFWTFECTTAAFGLLSYGVVYLRQKRLERLLVEKVNRQIAAGV